MLLCPQRVAEVYRLQLRQPLDTAACPADGLGPRALLIQPLVDVVGYLGNVVVLR